MNKEKYYKSGKCPECGAMGKVNVFEDGYWNCTICNDSGNIDDEVIDKQTEE